MLSSHESKFIPLRKYSLPFFLEVQQQEKQQIILTPSKLNFSSGFTARSRRGAPRHGEHEDNQSGNIHCSNNWMPAPHSFGETGDHSLSFPHALMADDRHFPPSPLQQAAAQHLPCWYRAQHWERWGREAL